MDCILKHTNFFCSASAGLLLAAIFDDLATTMQAGIGSFYPNLLLSGKWKIR
jgi:hypothetical protein